VERLLWLPRAGQERPPQEDPRAAPECPKRGPRAAKRGPGEAQERLRRRPGAPRAARMPKMTPERGFAKKEAQERPWSPTARPEGKGQEETRGDKTRGERTRADKTGGRTRQ